MSMFMMFDPNIKSLPLNFLPMMIIYTIMLNKNYWKLNKTMKHLKLSSMNLMKEKNSKPLKLICMSMMMMMLLMNFTNLIPYWFAITSNMMFNLSMTLMMWSLMMTYMTKNNMNILFMNMSPKSTPMLMMFIINMIELNSLMFQIISLTMRLMINMMMGHIIMNLMNNFVLIILYSNIEIFIILIQSYIFITLNMLNLKNMN